ncbi:hypothetical protein NDU88_003300 [Pleurodeles waltl]|uniref:Rho-GAP domain-containing protein n=1 Tax=Pleurodeles waltl TaxID=8319 RepID=A0AAV7SFH9_PLEWA|nr:hypothetical protein NDU88_003300 [Pleurodeles waltl]
MCSAILSTQKHSHSRAVRPHQTTLQETTMRQPRTPPQCHCRARENGTRGTVTSTDEEDDVPLSHANEERKGKSYKVRSNDAAGLLKMFRRELPSPLFTVEYLPAFIALVQKISKIKLQLQALHLLIMLLPDANGDVAKALLQFFKKAVANEDKNKMSFWNVSMILAPNLFLCKGKSANQEEMKAAASTGHIVRLLIRYQDILWTVPSFLISQVIKMSEAAATNNKKQLTFDKSVGKLKDH